MRKHEASELICQARLGEAIDALINRTQLRRSRWGILIQALSPSSARSETLYARNADCYFIPASSSKLLTTAAALHKLNSQFRIRTSVYRVNSQPDLTILRVIGRGDPSLTDAELKMLAQQLRHQGIRHIDQLIGDDHYFRGSAINRSWEWEDILSGDCLPPINSLILNQNVVRLKLLPQALGQPLRVEWVEPVEATRWEIKNNSMTVESAESDFIDVWRDLKRPIVQIKGQLYVGAEPELVTLAILNPVRHFLRRFRQALSAEQITVAQTLVALSPNDRNEQELAAVESPSLSELLVETNQESNNLYAESLLRTLGAIQDSLNINTDSTAEIGLAVIKTTLTKLGVDPEGYVLSDGSGLSRRNLVSPEALVQTLKAMEQSPQGSIYRASLPVAGISGTLRERFHGTPAQGILQAKTGTLSGVGALSGYLSHPDYQLLVFSIIVNQSDLPAITLRQAIDEIVLLITRLCLQFATVSLLIKQLNNPVVDFLSLLWRVTDTC